MAKFFFATFTLFYFFSAASLAEAQRSENDQVSTAVFRATRYILSQADNHKGGSGGDVDLLPWRRPEEAAAAILGLR